MTELKKYMKLWKGTTVYIFKKENKVLGYYGYFPSNPFAKLYTSYAQDLLDDLDSKEWRMKIK